MSNVKSFSQRSKNNALSQVASTRESNWAFLFCTYLASDLALKVFTTDFCFGYAKENRGETLSVDFEENAELIFSSITLNRSSFEGSFKGLIPAASTNIADAIAFNCSYLVSVNLDLYQSFDGTSLKAIEPDELTQQLRGDVL